MKPSSFVYHAPQTRTEALELLGSHGDDAKVLAGGQSLVPVMALRLSSFDHLVDINRIDDLAHVTADGDDVRIGAMMRQTDVLGDASLAITAPLVTRATAHIGHFQIRNRGTVGGSLSHADGAAELPAVMLTLGAHLEAASVRGVREIPAAEFFVGPFMTALEADELLTGVSVPAARPRSGFAVDECTRRQGDFAMVGAMCAVHLGADDIIDDVALTFFGVASTPIRASAAEGALTGAAAGNVDAADVGAAAVSDLDFVSDIHATAAYRKKVAALLAGRVLTTALTEARA